MRSPAVGQQGVDGAQVMHHVAVTQRARAATVVACHAAQGCAVAGRYVDRVEQALRLEPAVELVQHQTRFDPNGRRGGVEITDPVEILAVVHDQRGADGLPDLRGTATARQHRYAGLGRDLQGRQHVLPVAWNHYPDRLDLVNRRVGAVAAAAERIEQHLAFELAPQQPRQSGIADASRR